MDMKKIAEIVDRHVNQEMLAKDLALEFVKPAILAFKAKVESGEVDPVKGTDLDKAALIKAIDLLIEKM